MTGVHDIDAADGATTVELAADGANYVGVTASVTVTVTDIDPDAANAPRSSDQRDDHMHRHRSHRQLGRPKWRTHALRGEPQIPPPERPRRRRDTDSVCFPSRNLNRIRSGSRLLRGK